MLTPDSGQLDYLPHADVSHQQQMRIDLAVKYGPQRNIAGPGVAHDHAAF